MAALVGAILAALGVAGYAAGDFLDIDPVETASIAKTTADAPRTAITAQPVGRDAAAGSPDIAASAQTAQTVPNAPSPDLPRIESAFGAQTSSPATRSDNVSTELRNQIAPPAAAAPVLVPPSDAIHVAELAPDVAVAESEAEVAKLESALGMAEPAPETEMEIARLERAAAPSEAAAMPAEADTAAMGGPYIPVRALRPARVTRHVNLREGPADEARVIAVIPTNASVQAETDCGWCAVTYNGKQGYIYKGFLNGRGGGARPAGGRSRAAKKLTGKPGLY